MQNEDTTKLLRECGSGIEMAVASIDEVVDKAKDQNMKKLLTDFKEAHEKIGDVVKNLLIKYDEKQKSPNPLAKGMSWVKTNIMTTVESKDATIADLIVDGCNMGVKSLARFLNQFKDADEESKSITNQLIGLEEKLSKDLRAYL